MLHLFCRSICLHLAALFPSSCTCTQTSYSDCSSEDRATTEHRRNKINEGVGDGGERRSQQSMKTQRRETKNAKTLLIVEVLRPTRRREEKKLIDMQGRTPAKQRRTFWDRWVRTPPASTVLISLLGRAVAVCGPKSWRGFTCCAKKFSTVAAAGRLADSRSRRWRSG